MNLIQKLQYAAWEYKRNKAELYGNSELFMQIRFKRKYAEVETPDHNWLIRKEGFWHREIFIVENEITELSQRRISFFGCKNEITISGRKYYSSRKQFKPGIIYKNETAEIIEYKLNAFGRKPKFIFNIKSPLIPEKDFLLLTALGLYSIRNLAREQDASIAASSAVIAGA